MTKEYSHSDVVHYALNYAINLMHGGSVGFINYKKNIYGGLRKVKNIYDENPIFTESELNTICTKYGEDSLLDFNLIFDNWYKIYLRSYKIKIIKDEFNKGY